MQRQVFALAALAVAGPAAMASDAVATDTTVVLDNVEIVANRATHTTPVAFTNISKAEIDRVNNGRDVPYLLSMTPSFVMTSDAGAGVGYSSMRVRGSDGTRINVTANGIPINDAESHIVYWVNMPDLVSSVRDIQVQRGAGTSTNGAGAFGASVNMITDAPSEESYAELSGGYGSYNTNRETLRVGSGLVGGHWSADARVSHIGSDGYIDRATSQLWSYLGQVAYSSYDTQIRLLAFGGKERTYMAWDYASKSEMDKYGRRFNPCGAIYEVDQYGQLPRDADGNKIKKITGYYPDQYDTFTQHHFQLHLAQTLGEKFHLNAALHYTDDYGFYEQFKSQRDLSDYGLKPYYLPDGTKIKKQDLVRKKFNDNSFGGGTAALRYRQGRVDAVLGGSVNYFHGRHFGQIAWVRNYVGTLDPLEEYYNNTGKKWDGDVYLRGTIEIIRGLSGFADLQYRGIHYTIDGASDNPDWNTGGMYMLDVDRWWNFFNPKVGFNYTAGAHRAYASWSVAHREPSRSCFTDGDRRPEHQPQAERLDDYELGYIFTHRLFSVGANLYYMDYKDQLVVTGALSDTGNPLSVNVPDSYRMGIEFQGTLKPCTWFDWEINAALSRNRIKVFTEVINDDDWADAPIEVVHHNAPIAFSPAFTANNGFNFHYRGLDATLRTHYVSRQYMMNTGDRDTSLDPYCVSDLFLSYSFGKVAGLKDLKIGASVNNIFSTKYESNGYAGAGYYTYNGEKYTYTYAGYAAQAPINFMGTVTLKF